MTAWEQLTPADFGLPTDQVHQQQSLFPVDDQGRPGGDLFETDTEGEPSR